MLGARSFKYTVYRRPVGGDVRVRHSVGGASRQSRRRQWAPSTASPLVYAATEADVSVGEYWSPSFVGLKGAPSRGKMSHMATNDAAAATLWAKSEEVTGVSYLG